jgi:hypothetical protein
LPAFVTAEIDSFLRCGILAHGFVLARCGDCGWSRPVAFSCKRRGFCPSCIGRRMADFAAHLVDRVVPTVPLRQWVLTVPYPLRARMMFEPALTSLVLRQLIAAVSTWLRRRARRLGVRGALKTGAIAVIQRFNSAAAASPHFHTLFLDGVFAFVPGAAPMFHPMPAPHDEDVARVAASVFRRVERRLSARDREGLERIARYLARPPIANDRLIRLDDGRLQLELKRPWRDGTTAFVFTPHELVERLVALVPRPRAQGMG